MDRMHYHDGNVYNLLDSRYTHRRHDVDHKLQMHSSLIRRLSLERELEGHECCVYTVAWNSSGSLLISGSDDLQVKIWSYSSGKLLHYVDTGHSGDIFCTKFVPETSDELVVSGAGDAEVRLFNLTRLNVDADAIEPYALFRCHTGIVKELAVEVGNPRVFWSASHDGTLRQHDLREAISCPSSVSSHHGCRNVLLDLRSGAKRSLADPPKETLALKSCHISSTRPHLLLVGGSDAFGRLYDRRMLPTLTSCAERTSPPQCVNYFCPLHLSKRGPSDLHLTHVAFSPDGKEVLLSYRKEHVYLMDVNQGSEVVQYTPGDVEKLLTFTPTLETLDPKAPNVRQKSFLRKCGVARLDKCRKLIENAKNSLETATDIYQHHALEARNEVLDGDNSDTDCSLRRDCLCIRAALLMKRKWKNDVHMAIRDCQNARRIDSSSFEAHYYMSEALQQIGKHKEAQDLAILAQRATPPNVKIAEKLAERLASIEKDLAAAKKRKKAIGEPRSDRRTLRDLPLSDIVYRLESNNDASHDMPRSETDDSDYDGESEVEMGTPMPGVDLNILHGSFNLRHRGGESSRENAGSIGSCGSPSSSSQNDRLQYQPEGAVDMKQRYVGHCNIGTDLKQANFLGQRGEYIASGSDDGRWFIWEKRTGRLVKMILGDDAVVNCIQPHPFDCAVATSGLDNTIKIWTPNAPISSIITGESPEPGTAKVLEAMEINQRKMGLDRELAL